MSEAPGYQRTELPSGLRVLTEHMPGARAVTIGIWAGVGSRDETPRLAGASHYLEHLLFKGTARRSAREIAEALDAVGGDLNAFTTKEYTCYHARILDRDAGLALDVLADMVRASRIAPEDVEAERTVILEEIGMHADAPDDAVHDVFAETLFGTHPLGRPVLGTVESITAIPRDSIHRYWRKHYVPGDLVVSAAGNVRHEEIVELAAAALEGRASARDARPTRRPPVLQAGVAVRRRTTEQGHVVLGTGGLARGDDRRFALGVMNVVLGGGMSSRLFQEVRERRGLVYSVYSYGSQFAEIGTFGVYAGSAPKRTREVLRIVREEIARMAADGITEEELERGRGHLKGSAVLELEDSAGRMARLGKSELTGSEILTPDQIVERVDAVGLEEVHAIAKEVLGTGPWALAAVGPFRAGQLDGALE